jgi:hypothetical protein
VEKITMKLRLTIDGEARMATLIDSETTQDFVSLLPLTLTTDDLFGRESSLTYREKFLRERNGRTRTKSGTSHTGLLALTSLSTIDTMVRRYLTLELSSSARSILA